MKRLLSILLLVLCVCCEMHAQHYNIHVKSPDGKPLKGVIVYSFPLARNAEAAYKEGKNNGDTRIFDKSLHHLMDEEKTNEDGFCTVECMPTGSFILDGGDVLSGVYDFKLFHIKKLQKNPLDITFDLVLEGKEYVRKNLFDKDNKRSINHGDFVNTEYILGGEAQQMEEVLAKATPTMLPGGGGVERHGRNRIRVAKELDILGEYARADARFVAFPYVVYEDVKDSFSYMPPVVVDGKSYERSMVRRMSFDASRDKLDDFHFDASVQLQNHGSERILYSQWVNVSKGTNYHIPGILWYEDYNGVYHRDSLLFSDGKEREPMRFLNWSDARRLAPLNREPFFKRGSYEAVPENASYNLQFEQGRSSLNLKDLATVAQRDSMLRWLDSYYRNKDGQISNIIIRGYSSPEGLEKRNRELSRERAETIRNLLKARYGNVLIEVDPNYDNIVPWHRVADIMTAEMDDTLAHMYAVQIRDIIADKEGMDAQYWAIKANKQLYDYLDKYVLDCVRIVDIQANIIVSKILTNDEIIERYERDREFRQRMEPYQYYVMLCHLADNERWDELYEVAKRAYEKYSKEREVQKQFLNPASKDSSLTYVATRIPYPLAGYYYAVATMRKGMTDVNILKPYLDDGALNRTPELNSIPFIVAQVLMYCQGEEFDGANALIKKYNLMSFPDLKGLIMFVRCLDGQYRGSENKDVRDYVMSTSEMNKAVLYAALGQYREALSILYDNRVSQSDAKVEYLKAICHFRLLNGNMKALDVDGYSPEAIYVDPDDVDGNENGTGISTTAWAAPMFNALRLDEGNAEYLAHDGYFNNAYRQMVLYCWSRLKTGVPIEKVAEEYSALVARMRKNKAQVK